MPDTNDEDQRKIKIPMVIVILLFIIISLIIGLSIYFYSRNEMVHNFIDEYIFRKEVLAENVPAIDINASNNPYICTVDKYLIVFSKNKMIGYEGENKSFELEMIVNNPIMSSSGKYLIAAENKGKRVYVISSGRIIWQRDMEGEIQDIYINKNGYVAVNLKQSSYTAVIKVFSSEGKELFTNYLASTYAIDLSISNDNKYLAIAEVKTSGIKVESSIKIISMEKAGNGLGDFRVGDYPMVADSLITNIHYQDKNKLVCGYDNKVEVIDNGNITQITEVISQQNLFLDTSMLGNIVTIEKASTGILGSDIQAKIINIDTKEEITYGFESVPKAMTVSDSVVAVNLGTEAYFVNKNGWLIKRYKSNSEIKKIYLCSNYAAVLYREKIEIIKF